MGGRAGPRADEGAARMNLRDTDIHALALVKIGKILGPVRARSLVAAFASARGVERLSTPEQLQALGDALVRMGGIERAVGSLLSLQAALLLNGRGA